MGRIVGLDSDTAVLPRASRTSLPCCIPSRGYTQAGRLRGSVQTMADFQIHSKQKLLPPFNNMVTPCCLVHCFVEMSRLRFQTRNAVRTGKEVIQMQRDYAVVTTEFPQNRHLSTKLHGVTSQETIILIWVNLVIFVTDLFCVFLWLIWYFMLLWGANCLHHGFLCSGKTCFDA